MTITDASLTPEQIASFRTDGFHFPIDILSEPEAERALVGCRQYLDVVDKLGGFFSINRYYPKLHLFNSWAYDVVRNERVLSAVESLIGPDLLVWSTELFSRAAGGSASMAWHQDAVYYGLEGVEARAVRVWIALTPATRDNGTMRYSRGSHLRGPRPHGYRSNEVADKLRGEEILIDIEPATEVEIVLRPGQASMHNMFTAHCSGLNTSAQDRLNLAVDYLAPSVVPSGSDSALLVRGRDTYGYFRAERPPEEDFGETALRQAMEATVLRLRRNRDSLRQQRDSTTPERN